MQKGSTPSLIFGFCGEVNRLEGFLLPERGRSRFSLRARKYKFYEERWDWVFLACQKWVFLTIEENLFGLPCPEDSSLVPSVPIAIGIIEAAPTITHQGFADPHLSCEHPWKLKSKTVEESSNL